MSESVVKLKRMRGPEIKRPMSLGKVARIDRALATSTPAMFAKAVNAESWRLYKHLKLLDKYLLKAISGECPRLIVQMPPQHGKSQLISEHLPVWYLGKFPDRAVMLCSYEADYAKTWGRKSRRLMEKWGQTLFGVQVAKDTRAADNWEIEGRRGILQTAGVGGPVTGKKAHLLIIDDPVKNAADAMSPTMRERAKDWFRTTSSTRMQKKYAIIVVQTRWHEDDLAGWLQTEFPDMWTVVNLPAIAWGPDDFSDQDEYKVDVLGRAPGEALCPNLHPLSKLLDSARIMGEFWFSALYQGRPVPASGGIFKEACFRYWSWNPPDDKRKHHTVVLPEKFDYIIQSWDMTYKDTSDSDWCVGQIWGAKGADRYLLGQFREKCGFPQAVRGVKAICSSYFGKRAKDKLVEARGVGPAVVAVLQSKIGGFKDVEPEGSKEARAHGVTFQFEAGNVYFPDPSEPGNEWVNGLLYEFKFFPAARHDDQVDCATQALAWLWEKQAGGAWKVVKRDSGLKEKLERGPENQEQETVAGIDRLERRLGASAGSKRALRQKKEKRRSMGGRRVSVRSMLEQVLG